jgi:hypothetical protein
MGEHQASVISAEVASAALCSELGDTPIKSDHNHGRSDCPCGPSCAFHSLANAADAGTIADWRGLFTAEAQPCWNSLTVARERGSGDVSARGPPVLI